jgi:hypothetical protein
VNANLCHFIEVYKEATSPNNKNWGGLLIFDQSQESGLAWIDLSF